MERHVETDHFLTDMSWHLSILYARSSRDEDCDSDHYLVVVQVMERLAASK
jgi:hypothetical protein